MSSFPARTDEQVAHDLAHKAAAEAHAAVMAPARDRYEAAIKRAKARGDDIPPEELDAWSDAYKQARVEYDRVMAEHGLGGET